MVALPQDLRYAVRMLLRSPGFTLVAVITLALGIGANTAIFSFVDGVLLKPLPYGEPERIVTISERPPGLERNLIAAANFLDWRNLNTVFDAMAAQAAVSLILSGGSDPVFLRGARVSAPYFDVFGVKPLLGRTFATGEDQEEKSGVAMVSYRTWRERFGGDAGVLGRTLSLNGKPHTLIGVLPKNSAYDTSRTDIWVPLVFLSKDTTRNFRWLRSYGRLKPGVTIGQARAEIKVIGARIEKQYPDTNKGWGVTVDLFIERVAGDQLRRSLYVMMAAVGAVLLIGCANLANLMLARGASREKEVAIRGALGAGRGRLMRQFLTESILLSLLGGLAGLALGCGLVAG